MLFEWLPQQQRIPSRPVAHLPIDESQHSHAVALLASSHFAGPKVYSEHLTWRCLFPVASGQVSSDPVGKSDVSYPRCDPVSHPFRITHPPLQGARESRHFTVRPIFSCIIPIMIVLVNPSCTWIFLRYCSGLLSRYNICSWLSLMRTLSFHNCNRCYPPSFTVQQRYHSVPVTTVADMWNGVPSLDTEAHIG